MQRRKTKARESVVRALRDSEQAMSQDMLADRITSADRATIYRTLNRLREDGLVHRVVGNDGKQYFALCTECARGEHHHDHFHFKCRNCGRVECLEERITVSLPTGYRAEAVSGFVTGVCDGCTGADS